LIKEGIIKVSANQLDTSSENLKPSTTIKEKELLLYNDKRLEISFAYPHDWIVDEFILEDGPLTQIYESGDWNFGDPVIDIKKINVASLSWDKNIDSERDWLLEEISEGRFTSIIKETEKIVNGHNTHGFYLDFKHEETSSPTKSYSLYIESGFKILHIWYEAEPEKFDEYLDIVLDIVDSIEMN